MKAAWALVAAGCATLPPTKPPVVDPVKAFLAFDVSAVERAGLERAQRGLPSIGTFGVVEDLSRFVRCLALGDIPAAEAPEVAAVRWVVRYEAARLERRRTEGAPAGTPLDDLFGTGTPYKPKPLDPKVFITWPLEAERWPNEVPEPRVLRSACTEVAVPALASPELSEAERTALVEIDQRLEQLPAHAGVLAYMLVERRSAAVPVDPARIARALDGAPAPYRSAGRLRLALESPDRAITTALLEKVVADREATPAERSRARVRLLALLEPDFERVLAMADEEVRPEDWSQIAYAKLRALAALDRRREMLDFGRKFWRDARRNRVDGFVEATENSLIELALELDVGSAIGWIAELYPPPSDRQRIRDLARREVDRADYGRADQLYEVLLSSLPKSRALAAVELPQLLAEVTDLAYRRGNGDEFRTRLERLVGAAKDEAAGPRPHRALLWLLQSLGGTLKEAGGAPAKAAAKALVQAIDVVAPTAGVLSGAFGRQRSIFAELAGVQAKSDPAGPPPPRLVGRVVVDRIGERLAPVDTGTPLPELPIALIYPTPEGWELGAPWRRTPPR